MFVRLEEPEAATLVYTFPLGSESDTADLDPCVLISV